MIFTAIITAYITVAGDYLLFLQRDYNRKCAAGDLFKKALSESDTWKELAENMQQYTKDNPRVFEKFHDPIIMRLGFFRDYYSTDEWRDKKSTRSYYRW